MTSGKVDAHYPRGNASAKNVSPFAIMDCLPFKSLILVSGDERLNLMNKLSSYDYKTSLAQLQGKRCNNTVEWLDDDDVFKKWRTSPESSILWFMAKCKALLASYYAETNIHSGWWQKRHDVNIPITAHQNS
jgi:hypothetical protein